MGLIAIDARWLIDFWFNFSLSIDAEEWDWMYGVGPLFQNCILDWEKQLHLFKIFL